LLFFGVDKLAIEECSKSLDTLTRLACNPECTSTLVDGLVSSFAAILDVAEHQDGVSSGFDKLVRCLLNQIVKVGRCILLLLLLPLSLLLLLLLLLCVQSL